MTAGFVLVGGHSSRMGRDKALLGWGSGSLVDSIARRVAVAAGNVALIGASERYANVGWDCFPDLRPEMGPLAGIEAALALKRGELNLIVACDMPGMETAWLRRLLEQADASRAECVATRDADGRVHPLCAVYKQSCLAKVRQALDERRLRLHELVQQLETLTLDSENRIWNVNTPAEWKAWSEQTVATDAE